MPKATQLNLRLPNETGTLARLCRDLADQGVNLLALAAPDTSGKQAVVRLLVANPELAAHHVAQAGYKFTAEEVIYVELKNRPGALAKMMEKLERANVNVRYAYATAFTRARKTGAVIAVAETDLPTALKLLG